VDLSVLPALNAVLNGVAALLLIVGRALAVRGQRLLHKRVMLGAFSVSTLFLACYGIHKASRGFTHATFHAEGALQLLYRLILFSHIALAMTVPCLAIGLIVLGWRDQLEKHRRLARVAWPIWMYVSLTGIAIYLMLYPLNPAVAPPPAR
jgi:uncharacterized membrane protein YozB (DUF420 family)